MLRKLSVVPRLLAVLAVITVLGFGVQQAVATPPPTGAGCPCDFNDPDADEFCEDCCGTTGSRCSVADFCVCA